MSLQVASHGFSMEEEATNGCSIGSGTKYGARPLLLLGLGTIAVNLVLQRRALALRQLHQVQLRTCEIDVTLFDRMSSRATGMAVTACIV